MSLDCILSGRAVSDHTLEKIVSGSAPADPLDFAHANQTGQLITQFTSLSNHHKERLMGYLDALCREDALQRQIIS